jgi:hypothetical protein
MIIIDAAASSQGTKEGKMLTILLRQLKKCLDT